MCYTVNCLSRETKPFLQKTNCLLEQNSDMDRLPQELLGKLAASLAEVDDPTTRSTLFCLRLVNRSFALVAAPVLFKSIPLWIGLTSIHRLIDVSNHEKM